MPVCDFNAEESEPYLTQFLCEYDPRDIVKDCRWDLNPS